MPVVTLVVCIYKERQLLERLLRASAGCFDDLIVIHDGPESAERIPNEVKPSAIDYARLDPDSPLPDGYSAPLGPPVPESIHALVRSYGGRFFEGGRSFQQEPHWPFAWSQARDQWILRLDADEFPSTELCAWMRRFRAESGSPAASGYTCVWPLWNGRRVVTRGWPGGRVFLFNRERVRFFGMVEQGPIPDTCFEALALVLHHQPVRKSFGIRNILYRRQAYLWRRVIAQSLMHPPTDLPCWRWTSSFWPEPWQSIRMQPLRHSFLSLLRLPLAQLRGMIKARQIPNVSACLNPGLHHFMLGLRVVAEQRRSRRRHP